MGQSAWTTFFVLVAALGLAAALVTALRLWRLNRQLAAELDKHRRDETVVRSTMENMAEAVVMVDADLRLSNFNHRFVEITGFDRTFLRSHPPFEEVLRKWAGENALDEDMLARAVRRARWPQPFRHTFVHHGRDYEGKHVPLPGGGFVRTISDVTEQHRAEAVLRDSEARLRQLLALAPTAILVSDRADGAILFANQKAADMAGVPIETLQQFGAAMLYGSPEDRVRLLQMLNQHGAVSDFEVRLKRADGTPIWALISAMTGEFGGQPAVISAISDITGRKQMEQALERASEELEEANRQLQRVNGELAEAASTDRLTELSNRRRMEEVAQIEVSRAQRYRQALSVILFDVDWFKSVNDRFGHATGDAVLQEVARRTASKVRASDVLARWGGEEFLLLAPSTGLAEVLALAEKMRRLVEGAPFAGAGTLTASFGVAEFDGSESFSALVARADRALYRAKDKGRNRVEWSQGDESLVR